MKKKTIIKILVITIILFLIAFGVYTFINSFKEDKEITKEKMEEIIQKYEKFSESVLTFAKGRDYIYNLRENTYLEEYSKNTENWNKLIKDHQKNIENVEKNSKTLKENCQFKYADPNINSKCTVFKSTYEAAMNYYISDIKSYNKSVKEYNKWAKTNNKKTLNKGKLTIYKNYIDYDKDKEYFGKEEEENE
ncbi:MAG: hypothetical protein HFH46_03595 [Bacilli bacterium]|nr:hypothetical protein [Bacilli bacterium]